MSYCFTDGHAIVAFSHFYDDLADLDQIDWEIMKATYWSNTSDDPDRKRHRQAEFLVHNFVPWDLVSEIGVMNTRVAQDVETLLSSVAHRPVVQIHRDWYYYSPSENDLDRPYTRRTGCGILSGEADYFFHD